MSPFFTSPMLGLFALCLAGGAGLGAVLFRREWRAAARTSGAPAPLPGEAAPNGGRIPE